MTARKLRLNDGQGRQPTKGAIRTHDDVAAELGITRGRVVQLEKRAIEKLKALSEAEGALGWEILMEVRR